MSAFSHSQLGAQDQFQHNRTLVEAANSLLQSLLYLHAPEALAQKLQSAIEQFANASSANAVTDELALLEAANTEAHAWLIEKPPLTGGRPMTQLETALISGSTGSAHLIREREVLVLLWVAGTGQFLIVAFRRPDAQADLQPKISRWVESPEEALNLLQQRGFAVSEMDDWQTGQTGLSVLDGILRQYAGRPVDGSSPEREGAV